MMLLSVIWILSRLNKGTISPEPGVSVRWRGWIESHLAMHTEDNMRLDQTAEQARREAILQMGGVELTKQAWRDH
jgi:hypothetical protein